MKSLILFILIFYTGYIFAMPSEVFIIRHAEKEKGANNLSLKGYERAQALALFFSNSDFTKKYGVPEIIFAARPKDQDSSIRSIETVVPLSQKLNLNIRTEYIRDEYDQLARSILSNEEFNNKKVLISWAHNKIPELALHLGLNNSWPQWSDKVFDRVWVLKFSNSGAISFEDLPQNILPGDSKE